MFDDALEEAIKDAAGLNIFKFPPEAKEKRHESWYFNIMAKDAKIKS